MLSCSLICHRSSDDCQIVRLRSTGCIQYFFFLTTQRLCNPLTGFLYIFFSFHAFHMHGRRISIILRQYLYYQIFDGIGTSRRCRIIQICFCCRSHIFPVLPLLFLFGCFSTLFLSVFLTKHAHVSILNYQSQITCLIFNYTKKLAQLSTTIFI